MTISTQTTVNVALTSTALVPAAANRVALIISAPLTNRFTLSLVSTAILDQGLTMYPGQQSFALNIRDHGDIVTRAWSAISVTAAQNVTFISVFE